MSADFTPEKEDYKILTPFKMQVLTNFPYIEADFDALTNYQLLCKVVEYLNNVIANENEVTEQVTSLYNAYVSLQNYVNTYFDNLDLTEEVSNKLDEMATDGSLTNLIKDYIDPLYTAYETAINLEMSTFKNEVNDDINNLTNLVVSSTSGSPSGVYATVDALTTADPDHTKIYLVTADGKWYYYNGAAWTAGGTYQSTGISDNTVTPKKTTFLNAPVYNMIHLTDTTYTNNGMTAVSKDGVITVSGTATGDGYLRIPLVTNLSLDGWYNFTCFNDSETVTGQQVGFIDAANNYNQLGNFDIDQKNYYYKTRSNYTTFFIKFNSGDTISTTFKPMMTTYDIDNSTFYAYNDYGVTKSNFANRDNSITPEQTNFANNIGVNILDPSKLWENVYANNSPLNHFTNPSTSYCIYLLHLNSGDKIRCYPRIRNYLQADGTTYITKMDNQTGQPYVITADQDSDFYITFYNEDNNKMITIGENAVDYIPFTRTLDEDFGLNNHQINDINRSINVENNLLGKKYTALGDSFTHGDFTSAPIDNYHITSGEYTGQYKVYPYLIGNKNNMTVQNLAANGMTLTNINGTSQNYLSTNILSTIPEDVDYITIKIGINDNPDHQNAPLGTINDNTNQTFYGAYNIVMNYLISNYPNAHIGIIVSNGMTSDNFINATINIAKKFGVAYLNETTDYSIPYLIRAKRSDMDSSIKDYRDSQYAVNYGTNNHPNALCHELETIIVEDWLKRI